MFRGPLGTVIAVSIDDATDEELARVSPSLELLPHLETVFITHSQISDNGMRNLAGLTQVTRLFLGGNTNLTGEALQHLKDFDDLRVLEIWHAKIGDEDLKHLSHLRRIEHLELSVTQVTDKGLLHFAGAPNLKRLGLHLDAITDVGLKSLESHPNLEFLDLGETRVTNMGMPSLMTLKRLKNVSLGRTGVTDDGFRRLKAAFPGATISDR